MNDQALAGGPRVIHIGKYYPPVKGGMETCLRELARSLSGSCRLSIVVANTRPRAVREEMDGASVERMACFGTVFSQPVTPAVFRVFSRAEADIIHIHLPNPLACLAYLVTRPAGVLVVSYHADITRQRIFSFAYRPLVRGLLARARAIVVSSENLVRTSPALAEFRGKCHVIPHGIDPARFALTPEIAGLAAAIREKAGGPVIIFVGRLVYYKGLEYLLEAMRGIAARLIIVGTGPREGRLRRLARRLKVEDKVTWAGEVDDKDLPAYYHAGELFVLPSVGNSEGFSLVMLEAHCCGKPVVCTAIPTGVSFVNLNGRTGITVPAGQSIALARAIGELLENERLRRELGERARQRFAVEFNAREMGKRYLTLYETVLRTP